MTKDIVDEDNFPAFFCPKIVIIRAQFAERGLNYIPPFSNSQHDTVPEQS